MANNPEEPPPGVIGLPPSARGLSPIPADPSEHAVRSAREWEDVVEAYVQERMHELGVPEEKIGAIDFLHGKGRRAFVPQEQKGGTIDEFGRIFVDSGFLNPDLVDPFGPEASAAWKDSPARHRIDAILAHEAAEATGVGHEEAIRLAAETSLPVSDHARRILRTIAEAEGRRSGR